MAKRNNNNNCCVYGCLNKQKDSKLSFFKLPEDREKRNEWLNIIGRSDLLSKTDLKPSSYKVCSIHFKKSVMTEVCIRKLLPGAVPSKFVPNEPWPSTSKDENESHTSDVSTQTNDFYVNTLPVDKIKNASSTVETQTDKAANEMESHVAEAHSSDTARKRKLHTKLQEAEKKRSRLENELFKIKGEIKAKISLSLALPGNDDDDISKKF